MSTVVSSVCLGVMTVVVFVRRSQGTAAVRLITPAWTRP